MDVDTIVAQATPLGVGAVAIVRLSGPDAFGILDRITDEGRGEARRATLTRIVDPDDATLVDRALVTCFDGPASYTGEDVVEINAMANIYKVRGEDLLARFKKNIGG